jgi:uncharacterized protein (DUF952 family)
MLTCHLVPAAVWAALADDAPLRPASLDDEGFVHCTTGADEMVATANRHYRADPRAFVVLTVDLARVTAPWRYDSADTRYPHVYGELPRDAIVRAEPIQRAADGAFVAIGDAGGR